MRFSALAVLISVAAAAPHSAILKARALISDTFAWPSSTQANGNISYQYQITPLGNGLYSVNFYNTEPLNAGGSLVFTAAAVGTGNDGTVITRTLAQGTATTVTIQESGTEVQITIDNA